MATKEVEAAPVVTAEGIVVSSMGVTSSDIRYALKNDYKLSVSSEGGTEEEFLERILDADATEAAILSGGGALTKAEDLLDIPFRITAFKGLRNSDFQESRLGVYAIIDVADKDGTTYTTSISSNDAIVKVVRLHEAGLIPTKGWSMLQVSKKQTRAGFNPVNLVEAPDPTTF